MKVRGIGILRYKGSRIVWPEDGSSPMKPIESLGKAAQTIVDIEAAGGRAVMVCFIKGLPPNISAYETGRDTGEFIRRKDVMSVNKKLTKKMAKLQPTIRLVKYD